MTTGRPITILLLGISISLLAANGTQQCRIEKNWAYCSGRSLVQVPPLPPNITHVDLSLNYFHNLSEDSFIGLESLVHLDLGSQRVRGLVIKNNTFRGLYNLTFLHLGDNRGMQIETDAFQGLSNLRTLVLLHCDLDERILSGNYLRPLLSLQELNLFGNNIKQFTPAMFFRNMTNLSVLDLSINRMKSICESDLVAFQGKHFRLLSLSSVHLTDMNAWTFNWTKCGNPFKNMSFDTLDLSLTGLSTNKAKLFFSAILGTRINHLILRSNIMGSGFGTSNLKDPDRLTFEPLQFSGIKSIDLSRNFINVIKNSVFTPLANLSSITMTSNKINSIEKNAFLGLTDLQKLNLSHNLLGEIYSHTFMNLPNLRILDLSQNNIGALQYLSFLGLSNLRFLNLTGNCLLSVYNLSPLPSLQELHLDDNKIASVDGLQTTVNSATTVSLNKNRLDNMQDLFTILANFPNVTQISVGDNLLSFCSTSSKSSIPSSNRMRELHLQNNALQLIWERGHCLHLFDQLSELSFLSLSFNLLESLPDELFKGLSSLYSLDLSHNSLTHLPERIFPGSLKVLDLSDNFLSSPDPGLFRSLSVIDLKKNRFSCDCDLRAFLVWAKQAKATLFTPISQLYCKFPKAQRGVAIATFTTRSCDQCPCNCP
ncbi:toll-like receptor 5 [Alosa sapidissima]|uniref:toll-like receptor 5 n=1 Tax=Alosa sapidissima TaxID=34773 RepID=UPI001C09FFC6|nr:toll-like receptor 5 [Alosa sapidissima]